MKSLNLGILAHVDAGKTSLTERLLFDNKIIETLGSVDKGNTQTDSLALEQKRGITIKSAVTSFTVDNLKINIVDTPGHSDFIAEVERAVSVLDAVILVISAVEGVQAQTRVLMSTLKALHIPTIIFINKIDRMGARTDELLADIKTKLTIEIVAMNSVDGIGSRTAATASRLHTKAFLEELRTMLAGNNDTFLSEFVDNPDSLDEAKCNEELARQVGRAEICPVFFGSAITGAGIDDLMDGLKLYFANINDKSESTLSGVIFKIERGAHGEKIAYLRMYGGSLTTHSTISLHRFVQNGGSEQFSAKVSKLQGFHNGKSVNIQTAHGGDIVKAWGLHECLIGDWLGGRSTSSNTRSYFARPSLEVVVAPTNPEDKTKLYNSLVTMSEQDPFMSVQRHAGDETLSVRICGEVQKEVITDTLQSEFGVEADFHEMTVVCIERPVGSGKAFEKDLSPFLGTVGLSIESAPVNSGIKFQLGREVLGTMPAAFFRAVEETVEKTLAQGIHGWEVTDCVVTMTNAGYWPRQSHTHATFDKSMSSSAGDFRGLTPLVLMNALKQADVVVFEPMNQFELDIPESLLPQVLQKLASVEG